METVDQAPELYLEEIQLSLSEPADMETPGRRPTGASPETPDVKDAHTPSPSSESERTPTAWRVVHCILCVLTVVVVWSVALLPSVLTFSIIRSPVEVMDTIWQYKYGLSHSVLILLEGIEGGTDQLGNTACQEK